MGKTEASEAIQSILRPRPTKTLTICTDASVSHKHLLGTWAAYIRGPGLLIKTGGVIREPVSNPDQAEMRGMANAVWLARQHTSFAGARIILYCDNIHALKLHAVSKRKNSVSRQQIEWWDKHILPLLAEAAIWEVRHVKGHLPQAQWSATLKNNYMNDWCDKKAHGLLLEAVKLRKEKLADVERARKN